jgi:glyoxylase-like metal-dependent hydrolase (beta-lactamase superfamily II)
MTCSFEILLPGIPLTSTRGALGWCTVALIRSGGKVILFDTGSYNVRPLLLEQLKKRNLSPENIDIVFISHAHYDHLVNAELFDHSDLIIAQADFNYATETGILEGGDPYVPYPLFEMLKDRFSALVDEVYISDGIKAVALPGHTPGHMGLFLEAQKTLFAGDAVKNAWEFVHTAAPPPFVSEKMSLQSYRKIRSMAKVVVPGHDRPFRLMNDGKVEYTEDWSAEIRIFENPYQEVKIIRLP